MVDDLGELRAAAKAAEAAAAAAEQRRSDEEQRRVDAEKGRAEIESQKAEVDARLAVVEQQRATANAKLVEVEKKRVEVELAHAKAEGRASAEAAARTLAEERLKAESKLLADAQAAANRSESERLAADQQLGAARAAVMGVAAQLSNAGGGVGPPSPPTDPTESERQKLLFDMWSKAVDTQMHFNEMATKSRQLGLTFVVSALALGVLLIGKGDDWVLPIPLSQPSLTVPAIVIVLLVEILGIGIYWLSYPQAFKRFITVNRSDAPTKKRLRGLAVLVVVAPLALMLLCHLGGWSKWFWEIDLKSSAVRIHVSVLLVAASGFALFFVRILDLGVYHQMLRGAVAFGEDLEQQHLRGSMMRGLQKGMTGAISYFSRTNGPKFISHDALADAKADRALGKETGLPENVAYGYTRGDQGTAGDKVHQFYSRTVALLIFTGTLLLIFPNYEPQLTVKKDSAKVMARRFVFEAYPLWVLGHPGKQCPDKIEDLQFYMTLSDTNDPWGTQYKPLCGATLPAGVKGIGILSAGPDRAYDTDDDIRSWQ